MSIEQKDTGRTVIGKVISNKMDKTIVVEIERKVMHPLYGKYMRKFSKMYAHDNDNACKIGDVVQIMMCRPISKKKSWKLVQVINQVDKEVIG
jgi:small subunit ribosomal protein S17